MWSQSVLSAALLLVLPSPELASPHLYPASTYPLGSLHPVYYNGFYSPWNTFQPAVQAASAPAWQAASAPAWQAASAPAWQAASVPAWQAASAPARQAEFRAFNKGCGSSWTAYQEAGCYKYFGDDAGKKSWDAARQQCREEGYKVGAGDADLAYFETKAELDAVFDPNNPSNPLGDLVTDETTWLRGKMVSTDVKVLKLNEDTKVTEWTALSNNELPEGIKWDGDGDGVKPVQDINTDRRLFIKKSLKRLGVAKGSYEKGFLCEYKFKGCESDWTLDVDVENKYRRCLKVFTEKKNWKDAYDYCKSKGSTLAKLTPKATTTLKNLATGKDEIWVNEYSVNGINLVSEDGTVTAKANIGLDWATGYGDGTGTQRVFLNKNGELANNDGTGMANFMCQKLLYKEGVSVFSDKSAGVIKPLVRSLL